LGELGRVGGGLSWVSVRVVLGMGVLCSILSVSFVIRW
jgi:hypothetical protein